MMSMFLFSLLLAAADPASAQTEPQAAATTLPDTSVTAVDSAAASAEAGSKGDQDRIVCKTNTQTMSRFKKKTCHSQREWNRIAEENRRAYSEQRDRPVIEDRRDQ